jgi:hypothetical protein
MLKNRHGLGKPARPGEARGFSHFVRIKHVIHHESFLFTPQQLSVLTRATLCGLVISGRFNAASPSLNSVGKRGLDRSTGVQRSQHDDRGDRGASKLRRDVRGDSGKAQHLDMQHLSS